MDGGTIETPIGRNQEWASASGRGINAGEDKEEMKRLGFVNKFGEASMEDPNSEGEIDCADFYDDEVDEFAACKGQLFNSNGTKVMRKDKVVVDDDGYFKRVSENSFNDTNWH